MPRWRAEAFIPYHLAGKDLIPEHLEFVFTPQLREPHCQHSERAVELAVPWLKPSPSPASNNMSWLCFPLTAHHHFLPSADVKIKQTQRGGPARQRKQSVTGTERMLRALVPLQGRSLPLLSCMCTLQKIKARNTLGKHLGRGGIVPRHSGSPELLPAG